MEDQMTEETIREYQDYLIAEEHETGTVEKYLRDIRSFYVAFGKKGGKNADGGMERPPCKKWVFTIYGELYAFFPEWIPGVYGMGKMPGKVSADTEGAVSEKGTGFAAERV